MTGHHPANDAWEALLTAHALMMKKFASEDMWAGISMREYDVLYTLSKHAEPVRFSELNKRVLLSQPALSRLVDRLADRGLVKREPDPADRRGVLLALTEDGAGVQRQVGRRHARSVAIAMTTSLSSSELRQLEALCLRLTSQPASKVFPR